jgi:hypothetical protein
MVLVGCRHHRAVPLAFKVSAQFEGLAHMSVPTCPMSPQGTCRPLLGDLPTHVASRAHPQNHYADRGIGTAGGAPAIPVRRSSPRCIPTPPRKTPVKVRVSTVVMSGLPRNLCSQHTFLQQDRACTKRHSARRSVQKYMGTFDN